MKTNKFKLVSSVALAGIATAPQLYAQYSPTPIFQGKIGKTLADTKESRPKTQPDAPEGAPNVVWIQLDDVGYGATSAFGGLIETPNIDRLANNGLRYTNFHTCAFSAPTRAALLTGRNQHSVHFGFFASSSYDAPGYDGYLPFEKATIAEILRENGYNTFAVGKYHLTHPSDATQAGPFNRWPTGRGFDHYFGYAPEVASSDQWHPTLYRDTQREPDDPQGRHVNELFANEAIKFISDQKAAVPNKPFFLYFASGAGHSPHQVGKEWIDKYKGKFDIGWDKYRDIVLENQKKLGVVPQNATLAPQNPTVKPWDNLSADEKKLFLRHIELYAGFLSQTDHEVGRIIDFIEQLGQLDNTLVIVLIGDNGAEGAGREYGNFLPNDPDDSKEKILANALKNLDKLGTEYSSPLYQEGWAAATNTPFRYYKSYANFEGGTHDPLILFYPKKIKDKGGIRNQYSYVNDILPTTVELTGAKVPTVINGYVQEPIEGVSLAYSTTPENKNLPERHTIQYHEMTGSHAVYKDGWKASYPHDRSKRIPASDERWYLYNVREDFNEQHDLAAQYPEKVKELADLFDAEAWKYNVYPLKDEWVIKNQNIFNDRKTAVLHTGNYFIGSDFLRFSAGSYSITANTEIPQKGAEGIIVSSGTARSGISLYIKDKKVVFAYNANGKLIETVSSKPVSSGKTQIKVDVKYKKDASDNSVTLYVNDEKAAEKVLGKIGSAGSGVEVGQGKGTPVSPAYKNPYTFTGTIRDVIFEIK
jgi:arylsulfatase A-like enzyme